MKFLYCLNPADEKPIILLLKHIGKIENAKGDIEQGIDGEQFTRELQALEDSGKKVVEIRINSPGGVVSDGWSIYSAIISSKMECEGLNIGIAASTAGWIFEACQKRVMMDFSVLMMHDPHGGDGAGQKEYTDSIATMLAARSNQSVEDTLKFMKATTFMRAGKAKKLGYCDEVRPSIQVKLDNLETMEFADVAETIYKQGNEFLNTIFPIVKNKKMSQVTNLLNLNEDASEANIAAEIKKLQSRMNEMEDAEKEMEDKCNGYEDEKNEMTKKHKEEMDALNAKYDALNKEKEEEENKRNEDDCKNMVENYVKTGRIKADSKDKWINTAKTLGIAEAKGLIESTPLNVTAPQPFNAAQMEGVKTVVTSVGEWRDEWEEKNLAKK